MVDSYRQESVVDETVDGFSWSCKKAGISKSSPHICTATSIIQPKKKNSFTRPKQTVHIY